MSRLIAILLCCSFSAASPAERPAALRSIQLESDLDVIQLLHASDEGFGVAYSFSRIDGFEVLTPRGSFAVISMPGLSHTTVLGAPKVPASRKIFWAPLGAEVSASVVRSAWQEIALADFGFDVPLMPAQPSLSKSQRPEDVPFAFDETAYARRGFGDGPVVSVEELGIMRGMRLFALTVEPVRYDPSRNAIEVCHDLAVKVAFRGGDLEATRTLRETSASPYFEAVYRSTLLNYTPPRERDDLTQYPIGYVIVSNPMFQTQLQPFIQWKTKQGFKVFEGYVGSPEVGSTTTTIKAYIQGIYNSQNPRPTFVLFVGDVAQVPTWNGNTGSHVTDVHYVRLVGTDYMPEMYFGRFSARTTAELEPQIDKTLEYERYEMPDPSFLGEAVMIAGVDANYAPTYGNGQINYGTTYYFNAAHGIYSHTYLYPQSGSSAAQIVSDVSNGVGYANYTAHGSETSWSDPSFTITNINNLQNASQYPTVVGNCCLTNAFDTGNCFGEAWLRAENKGAIGYIGGTNSTYWDEDFWWGVGAGGISANPTYETHGPGAYDGMFHDHGEPFTSWYTTQYAFIMAGNLAVVQAGSSMINYYWEIYALMGDPSLATYFAVPSANTVSYPPAIPIGVGQIDVTADPYSYVGLSKDGVLCAAGLVGPGGTLTLSFAPLTQPGPADLVITRQNRIPVITTVNVIPNEGPYVIVDSTFVDDTVGGNGNAALDIGENPSLRVFLNNVGTEAAPSVIGTLSTTLPQITITNPTQAYGTLPAGATGTSATPYALQVGSVADGAVAPFTIAVTSGDSSWNWGFPLTVHAPVLSVAGYLVLDPSGNGNGRPDPGETVNLRVAIANTGSGGAQGVQIALGESDPYVSITGPTTQPMGQIPSGMQVVSPNFTVTFSQECPQGYVASFSVQLASNAGLYATSDVLTLTVGQRELLYVDSDDEATETRITSSLNNLGVQYRRWNTFETGMATIPLDTLRAYRVVLWAAGDQNTSSVTDANRANLATYLNEGGSLILSGENYLSSYGSDSFTTTYLHIASYSTSISGTVVVGEAGDPVGDGVTVTLSYPTGLAEYPDQVNPDASAVVAFRMQSSNVPVAIRYAGGGARAYRTMFFGAPLEAFPPTGVEPSTIQTVIARALQWAGGGDVLAPSVPGNAAMAGDGTLTWSPSSDNVGVDHYCVYRHTVAHFNVTGMTPHVTTAGTSVVVPDGIGDPSVNYFYRITAVDAANNESGASAPLGEFDFQMQQ